MNKGDSHKSQPARQAGAEALWNAAAVAGLLVIGVLLGGIAGVFLDRQGLLGVAPAEPPTAAIQNDPPAAAELPKPRLLTAAPELDREVLEAQYHEMLRRDRDSAPAEDIATLPGGWQGDTAARDPAASLPVIAVPDRKESGAPLWQHNAVAVAAPGERPMIAIVLDDVGVNRRGARKAIALPGPLTLSFMTYADRLEEMTEAARAAGHELMLHVPMQPRDAAYDPGPNVLRDDLPGAELLQRLTWGLDRFDGYVGANNHMGSRFTASPEGMALVMAELKARGLLFLDSLTAAESVAGGAAARAGIPYAVRDIFLDNEPDDPASIHRQLALLEQKARAQGYAVGIGHPHDATLAALSEWIPEMRARGFTLVPISAIVRHRQRLATEPQSAQSG
ncbi:MAG: divergent polysaccharide deacetylase family protein [Kiloniellaceae bacterium]